MGKMKPIDYKQSDSKWGALSYAVDGESSTIKSAGCGPTAMADVLAAVVSPYIDPITTASWARMKGYKVYKSGTSYSFPVAIGKEYGLKVRRINTNNAYGYPNLACHTEARNELLAGNWILACMGPGNWTKSGHYVVAYNLNLDNTVDIMDPASSSKTRAHNDFSLFKSQVKYYWAIELPELFKVTEEPKTNDYRHVDFVREVQMCCKAGLDGIQGKQTLSKTITISAKKNRKNAVVLPVQKKLKSAGLYTGDLDGIAGPMFHTAMCEYQVKTVGLRAGDGEATAGGRTWKKMLDIK